ncbi:phosphotransferase [Streptosporangium canum]|uniref:phosphotransferase n=1 Tax=Streptosporangium canum TaxID=324952 RepID=UPI0037B4D554
MELIIGLGDPSRGMTCSEVQAPRYLADGLMNRNWRIDAERGTFALKLIMDVALPTARRNLRILAALAADGGGVPVCSHVESISGDVMVEIDGRGYCLLPWAQGAHLRGTELSLNQTADLGALLGRIHHRLNRLGPETGVLEMPADAAHMLIDAARELEWGGPQAPGAWTEVVRRFRDGHTSGGWAADAVLGGYGPHQAVRLIVATADPATLPAKATWYLATNLPRPGSVRARSSPHPAADLAEIVRLYGLRTWIEQGYKQVKDELGWADFQVRSCPFSR